MTKERANVIVLRPKRRPRLAPRLAVLRREPRLPPATWLDRWMRLALALGLRPQDAPRRPPTLPLGHAAHCWAEEPGVAPPVSF
jgi:hypothetical protein